MIGEIILILSGLIVILIVAGILSYYYFFKNISWFNLNVWFKWILFGIMLIGVILLSLGIFLLLFAFVNRTIGRKPISDILIKYEEILQNKFKSHKELNNIFMDTLENILVPKTDTLTQEEQEILEEKFYILYNFSLKKEPEITKKIDYNDADIFVAVLGFYLAPSNRFIKNYFKNLPFELEDKNIDNIIKKNESQKDYDIPTRDFIVSSKNNYITIDKLYRDATGRSSNSESLYIQNEDFPLMDD